MKKMLLFCCTLSIAGFICAQNNKSSNLNNPSSKVGTNLKKHISTLASPEFEGRVVASKGDTLAFNYIIQELLTIPGVELMGNKGLQTYGFSGLREMVNDSTFMSINGKAQRLGVDYLPSMYSPNCKINGNIASENLIIIDATKESNAQIQEKMKERGQAAEKEKSNGMILVVSTFPNDKTTYSLSRKLPIIYVTQKIANKIAKGENITYKTQIQTGEKEQKYGQNIVARINAPLENNPKKEAIILGAHYDHLGVRNIEGKQVLYPGADDNASGTATIIELARQFAKNRNNLKRDVIIIAFGAEERGLIGSRYFVNNSLLPVESIVGMFNFDMTGRMSGNKMEIRGISIAPEVFPMMANIPNPDLLNLVLTMSGSGPTDYSSFNSKKIPALSFGTGRHADLHRPTDTEEKINYDGMERLHKYVYTLISRYAYESNKFSNLQ